MSSSFRWLASFLLLLLLTANVTADACIPGIFRRPHVPYDPGVEYVVLEDAKIEQAELRIPRRMLVADAGGGVSTRHAMAGLVLSVGIVGCGLWCLRFRGPQIPRRKLIVAGVMVALVVVALTGGGLLNADVPRPPQPPQPVPHTVLVDGQPVTVRIVEGGNEVQLVVPPALANKIR